MIACRHFIWLHAMKTGGHWVRSVILPHAPPEWQVRDACQHLSLPKARAASGSTAPAVVTVRNPWSWYRSMYTFMRQHWEDHTGGYAQPRAEWGPNLLNWDARFNAGWTFAEYVRWLPTDGRHHGPDDFMTTLTTMTGHFKQLGYDDCEYFLRHESIRSSLVEFLRRACPAVPPAMAAAAAACPPQNSSRHQPTAHYYTAELIERVRAIDAGIIERFGYQPPPLK